jgi:hypothetical protein
MIERMVFVVDIKIFDYSDGSSLVFTTDSPVSHYGIPVVRHEGCNCNQDYGPGDAVPECLESPKFRTFFGAVSPNMGSFITRLIWDKISNDEALRTAAAKWLAQNPSGPQIIQHPTGGKKDGGPWWEIK